MSSQNKKFNTKTVAYHYHWNIIKGYNSLLDREPPGVLRSGDGETNIRQFPLLKRHSTPESTT